jgi:hypothetical protein
MTRDFTNICQAHLPLSPWSDPRLKNLPGVNPLDRAQWILVDDAFDAQMAYVDFLLSERRDAVFAIDESADAAARELLLHLMDALNDIVGYRVEDTMVTRPDGCVVQLDWDNALLCARSLVQQDLCLMMPKENEHVLVGGAMCFPASWTLSEKFMRPMTGIHEPVQEYGDGLAQRVERMFNMMRPDQDLWRANWLIYNDPHLHQPRRGGEGRTRDTQKDHWVRVERQSLCKLPETQAIVFGIHTYVVGFDVLTQDQQTSLKTRVSGL